MSVDALRQFAAGHHGVITDEDAVALGVRAAELLDLVLGGELELIGRGVYRDTRQVGRLTPFAEAVALARPGAVVIEEAAQVLHGRATRSGPIRVAVPLPLPDGVRLPASVEVVVRVLEPADVTRVAGISVATVAATLRAPDS